MTHDPRPADAFYDLRGLKCPLPVMKTRRRLQDMAPGERLLIETTDPLSTIDIPNFCREEGHRLVETTEANGVRRFLIERGPTKSDQFTL